MRQKIQKIGGYSIEDIDDKLSFEELREIFEDEHAKAILERRQRRHHKQILLRNKKLNKI